jgi:hypothetical protein
MENYKEIKNYIHNDLKITKEDILEVVRQETQKQIEAFMKDETNFTTFIRKAYEDSIKIAICGDSWSFGSSFKDKITSIIKDKIGQMVVDKLDIKVKIK